MDKAFIAQGVATKLFATEKAVDCAVAEASQLLSEMMSARQVMGFSAVVGNEAAAKVAQAIAALSEARGAVVAAHNELADVQARLGIRTKLGVEPKGSPTAQLQREAEQLRRAG